MIILSKLDSCLGNILHNHHPPHQGDRTGAHIILPLGRASKQEGQRKRREGKKQKTAGSANIVANYKTTESTLCIPSPEKKQFIANS